MTNEKAEEVRQLLEMIKSDRNFWRNRSRRQTEIVHEIANQLVSLDEITTNILALVEEIIEEIEVEDSQANELFRDNVSISTDHPRDSSNL